MDTGRAVLIVDDDPSVLETMRVLLEGRAGFHVRTALGARGALRRLYSLESLGVLVVDVDVSDDCGAAICHEALRRHPDVALVAMSSDGSARIASPASAAFLPKPFGARELLAAIDEANRGAQARREGVGTE